MPEIISEKEVNSADAIKWGLTKEEYKKILSILGRSPSFTELGVFSALWSEHCSYKNSILQLKTFPTASKLALTKTGEENAGALDIGSGLAVVFKMESHNHPTALEPYQGAATGVGGIMRDIFTMGARPLCSLNSLRFGFPQNKHNSYLLTQAVKGIANYGNSLGIPVAGGEVFFDTSFSHNCLVNAMVVGIARHEDLAFAKAEGVGNSVFIVGAKTGRDGIHGAAFASKDLSENSQEERSAVQVGDPFMEKLLLEATLELLQSDAVVGIQDMGAAGLSCASSEMSAKGKVGMRLQLEKVPLREKNMRPWEIMLSESQERMLVVVKAGREKEIERIFTKWELSAAKIGEIDDSALLSIYENDKLYAEIPADSLVLGGGAPSYKRASKEPEYLQKKYAQQQDTAIYENLQHLSTLEMAADFLALLASPNICSRRPIYEQYDTQVGLTSIIPPGGDGGVMRIPIPSPLTGRSTSACCSQ